MNDLLLIVLDNFKIQGNEVIGYIKKKYDGNVKVIDVSRDRFSNGEGKVKILDYVNGENVFILSDIGNYGITYNMHGKDHEMSPDEHFQDIKRVIGALSGRAKELNVVMPLLYESRQHKRKGNESLDCAISLQELINLGVNRIITFDAHDPSICNAIPLTSFDNFFPTHYILNTMIDNESLKNVLVVSPDMGAMERARYYADMMGSDVGVFYKRRDLSKVINGKNPIVEHIYMGPSPENRDVIVVDDMIASGSSMLEVAENLKNRGARKIYFVATYALFTEGLDKFEKAYTDKLFDKLYTTNLSYIPDSFKNNWIVKVDCTEYIADIICAINSRKDLEPFWSVKKKILNKIKEKVE